MQTILIRAVVLGLVIAAAGLVVQKRSKRK